MIPTMIIVQTKTYSNQTRSFSVCQRCFSSSSSSWCSFSTKVLTLFNNGARYAQRLLQGGGRVIYWIQFFKTLAMNWWRSDRAIGVKVLVFIKGPLAGTHTAFGGCSVLIWITVQENNKHCSDTNGNNMMTILKGSRQSTLSSSPSAGDHTGSLHVTVSWLCSTPNVSLLVSYYQGYSVARDHRYPRLFTG